MFGASERQAVNAYNKSANMSQALVMLNSGIQEKIIYNKQSYLNKKIAEAQTVKGKINKIYLIFYSRSPKEWELKSALELVDKYNQQAYSMISTALLCSNEFLFIK